MIYVIGFLAQALFASRILIQWIMSEKARKIVSPTIFWVLSIIGSYLFFVYGWLRDDFSIILGQLISYYIYIWNLDQKGRWIKIPLIIRIILLGTPWLVLGLLLKDFHNFVQQFLQNKDIPVWMVIMGSTGQVIFTFRFVYQWIYSLKHKVSVLPIGFWSISLFGSGIIITYAVLRLDPVLIVGQSIGFIAYSRNIFLGLQSHKTAT